MRANPLIVIPTYNEGDNIGPLLEAIADHAAEAHVLVVDDNSQDGTAGIVEGLKARRPKAVHLLRRESKLGYGTACIAGFRWGLENGYERFVQMDADFSHDPQSLPTLIGMLAQSPVVIGSRYVPGGGTQNWGLPRRLLSRFAGFYARTILGLRVRDLTGGFNGWRKVVLEKISLDTVASEGYSFLIELKYRAHKAGFEIAEFPIIFEDRRAGESKMSFRIIAEAVMRVWLLRFGRH